MTTQPNLIARFSTTDGTRIQLHHPSCSVVAAYDGSPVMAIKKAVMFPWTDTSFRDEDCAERGIKVTKCKCAK